MTDCILHIGMHKTGSTSIQHSLSNFSDDRFLYAELDKTPNHSLAVYSLFAANPAKHRLHASKRSAAAVKTYTDAIWRDFDRARTAARGRTLILSGEGVVGLDADETQKMATFFSRHFNKTTVVAYVKAPAAFMSSSFQERIKSGRFKTFDLRRHYPMYQRRFEKFDSAFDPANVKLWKFDPSRFPDKDVVKDFCARLHLSLSADRIVRRNERLSRQTVALLYTYQRFRETLPGDSKAAVHKLIGLLKNIGDAEFRLSPDAVRPVLEHNRRDIAWMEKRLGEPLSEALGDSRPDDIREEADLLRPDRQSVAKLLETLGDAVPRGITVESPDTVALLVHALVTKHAPHSAFHKLSGYFRRTVD